MCKIPSVAIVAPADRHAELRRSVSSFEYEVTIAVTAAAEALEVGVDVALCVAPTAADLDRLRDAGVKTVSIEGTGADLDLGEPAELKTRIWELFRPR